MKNILSMAFILAFSSSVFAGGAQMGSHQGHNAMSSGKSSSGVHFYGRMYIGYDDKQTGSAADVENLDDGGTKSRLGLKFTESISSGIQLVGNLEYKFDIGDGTSTNDKSCASTSETTSCRTFDLHVGNLGFKTPYGYFGAGTFESPYKTMGQYDNNMDTAIALNDHGATSQGPRGIAGNFESALAYSATMGPATLSYMYAVSDVRVSSGDMTNTNQGDYSFGLHIKDMLVHGLSYGYSRNHVQSVSGGSGESNDRFHASMKVMPHMGVFVSLEDLSVRGSHESSLKGDITTIGTHYKMGMTDWQIVYAKGDSDGAATNDYKTLGVSAQMNLSKSSDLTFGYIKQDFDSTGDDITTRGIGLTHKF
jgi:predicted porin